MTTTEDTEEKYRVWWIPQVPMSPFYVDVDTPEEGFKLCDILANYDLFQYENNIKPDYSNVGGVQRWEQDGDGGYDWFDIGEDDWPLLKAMETS